ncbi:hypothetical protein ATCC90586_010742 [Pythium insidiosum]|nr:hypothetical protein ATCC90586_010742 [Pythium insidiosum]
MSATAHCIDTSAALLQAVQTASSQWIQAFNSGNAAAAAACYEPDAVMTATPFGTFTGRPSIEGFWTKLVDDGFTDVRYIAPQFTALSDTEMVVSANWTMNKAHGVITKELWVLQKDGRALLREDHFEVLP